jgi:hypothetical protein
MMTDSQIFNALFGGGNYTLPKLIKVDHDTAGTYYLVDDVVDHIYDGHTYKASSFTYTAPASDGTGGTLSIDAKANELIAWVENADEHYSLTVVGALLENGDIQPLRQYKHFHGSISYSEDMTIEFTLAGDDRLDMTSNPYMYDTETNPGNA